MQPSKNKLSLRAVVISTISVLVIGLVGGLYALASSVLTERFAVLEDREARLNVERVRNAVSEQYEYLQSKVQDWAYWDDAYTFVQDGNQAFRDSNLTDNALPNLKLNLLIYTNEKREIVAGLQYDFEKGAPMPLSTEIKKIVSADSTFLNFTNELDSKQGMVDLPEGAMMLVSKAVVTSEQKGPIKGALIFGQLFDQALTEKLSKVTRLSLSFSLANTAQGEMLTKLKQMTQEDAILLDASTEETINGYTPFFNVDGKPSTIVRAEMPRELMKQGSATIQYFIVALSIIGVIFGLVILFVLEKTVITRLVQLARRVGEIGHSSQAGERVDARGRDELSDVAFAINQMLGTVEDRNRTLKDIMDNVEFGFFVCNRDMVVQAGFTKSCTNLFSQADIAGKNLGDILQLNADKLAWYQTLLDQVYDDVFPEEASLGQLPSRFQLGSTTLMIKPRVLRDSNQQITSLLYSVTDVTALERSEVENMEHRTLIKILRAPSAFADFIQDVRNSCETMRKDMAKNDQKAVRRVMHTLKGNFGCFDLLTISRMIHDIEERAEVSVTDVESVKNATVAFLEKYFEVLRIEFSGRQIETYQVSDSEIAEIEALIMGGKVQNHNELIEKIRALRQKSIKELMGPVDDLVAQAAAKLGKKVTFELSGHEQKVDAEIVRPILEVLPHLLKNAIDHGIEQDFERGTKPENARLALRFAIRGANLEVVIEDDGRGLNFDAIVHKAVEKGLITKDQSLKMGQSEIANFIFLDGFTTADSVSEISGRGVGMAAVRAAVEKTKGSISIDSKTGMGCRFTMSLPLASAQASSAKRAA